MLTKFGIYFLPVRHFSATSHLCQRPDHPLYRKIDWERISAGDYAVVDPFDNAAILYLSEKEYKVQVRVSFSQDHRLIVLALPGDTRVEATNTDPTSSQNSPTLEALSKANSKVWKKFLNWHLSNLAELAKRDSKSSLKKSISEPKANASVVLTAAVLRVLIPYWGLDLLFRAGCDLEPKKGHVKALRELAKSFARILETRGPQALIVKLKNTLFFLNKYLAGHPSDDPWLLGMPVGVSKNGIPRLIPLLFRRGVGQRNPTILRMLTSLLNSYKAFEGSHEPQDLKSITDPHPTLDEKTLQEFETFCKEEFWAQIIPSYVGGQWRTLKDVSEYFTIKDSSQVVIPVKAGPNNNPALLGAPLDALAWLNRPRIYPLEWAEYLGDTRTPKLFKRCLSKLAPDLGLEDRLCFDKVWSSLHESALEDLLWEEAPPLHIGKVQCLPEPAGKVRTIAIVDYWTQRLMSPVHDWMMKILSYLPTDGTFNQEGALNSFSRYLEIEGHGDIFSIDLKSATDLIPIELYRVLFKGIWPEEMVNLWIGFLTDRPFFVPKNEKLVVPELRGTYIHYGRGQPMGTLSSWPSMALVHHALQLFAAKRAGRSPLHYVGYRVLGDDNVTKGQDVANAYIEIANALCVPTSKAKTLHGELFIFASQIYLRGLNISPLSLKEELGIQSYGQRLEIALRAARRGWLGDRVTIARFLRLLLNRHDYIKSVRGWNEGKLSKVSQQALVSAFGIASKDLLEILGFQGSGVKPFSLAIANKVQAVAGDQGLAGSKTSSRERGLLELERALAMRVTTHLIEQARGILADLQVASVRFRTWADCIQDHGFMPWATKIRPVINRKNGSRIPDEPGLPYVPGVFPKEDLLSWMKAGKIPGIQGNTGEGPPKLPLLCEKMNSNYEVMFSNTESRLHKALWEVVYDSFYTHFGVITSEENRLLLEDDDFTSVREIHRDYSDFEEDDGYGMTYSDEGHTGHPDGWETHTPGIVTVLRKAIENFDSVRADLLSESTVLPWNTLLAFAKTVSQISRLPAFTSILDISPGNIDGADELTKFIRLANIFFDILPFLPYGMEVNKPIDLDLPSSAPWGTSSSKSSPSTLATKKRNPLKVKG